MCDYDVHLLYRAAKVPLLSALNKWKRLRWVNKMTYYRNWNKVCLRVGLWWLDNIQ